ncbi:hypothetical protein JCM10908_004885 [Rhodotorula pacifica]|uniref:uncharacterized protein n=1 Tax=Rhodotorula pacifica TaxID=1495444 RepID=UPI0031785C16
MGLSKGTLGLKFMNRQAPVAVSPAGTSPASASGSTTPTTKTGSTSVATKAARSTTSVSAIASASQESRTPGQHGPTSAVADEKDRVKQSSTRQAGRPSVIHETSLLSFPLLSTLTRSSATANSSGSSMTATYSSMPLTSAMVSGRRSFGGANIEIEKLNDPSSHQTPPEGSAADSSKSKSKRPKKSERDAALVGSVRETKPRRGSSSILSGPKAGKRTADLDRRAALDGEDARAVAEEGGKKKRRKTDENGVTPRWEVDDNKVSFSRGGSGGVAASAGQQTKKTEFARPAGFDGIKKHQGPTSKSAIATRNASSSGGGKGKGRMNAADLMDDEQYRWAKQGETREWDAGKSSEDDSDGSSDKQSEESESDEDEEEQMVSSSSDDDEDEAIQAEEEMKFSAAADRAATSTSGRGRGGGAKGHARGKASQKPERWQGRG